MNVFIQFVAYLVQACLVLQVMYLLFFSLAGSLASPKKQRLAKALRRIRIFIPGYKEDSVILTTAAAALSQDYPEDRYEVVVVADSFTAQTLAALGRLRIKLVEVQFEKSTKGKALLKAIDATQKEPAEIVLILDADNHMAPGFLHAVNNAFDAGYKAVQGHRTAKSKPTAFAFLDACTEEINNHIFRRGHVAVGLPSALIGSGMAFQWSLFVELLQNIGDTAGEDKEMEFRLAAMRTPIAFLDGAFVFDEKVARNDVFTKQRSRWLAMQVEYMEKYFGQGWKALFNGNIAFFNKVVHTWLLPRVMLVALLCLWTLVCLALAPNLLLANLALLLCLAVALLLGIPAAWYKKELLFALLQIPKAFWGIGKSALQIKKARKHFVHTPHGEAVPK